MKNVLMYRASDLPQHPPIWQLLVFWLVCLMLIACMAGPDVPAASGGSPGGSWFYAKGPHGENCLFFADGSGQQAALAMDCDTVKPE